MPRLHALVGLLAAGAVGCFGAGPGDWPGSSTVQGLVGPAGGVIENGGGARVVVPPGALAADTPLRLELASPPGDSALGGTAVSMRVRLSGPAGLELKQPVLVTVRWDPARLPIGRRPDSVRFVRGVDADGPFARLAADEDAASRSLSVRTLVPGDFVAMSTDGSADLAVTAPPTVPVLDVGVPATVATRAQGCGAVCTWSVLAGAVPKGLMLGADGTLAGTPEATGRYVFMLGARKDASLQAERVVQVDVRPAEAPLPVVSSLAPQSAPAGSPLQEIVVAGESFVPGAQVLWQGKALPTRWVDATRLAGLVPASLIKQPGTFEMSVRNPAPGGGTSAVRPFVVTNTTNPVPVVTALEPDTLDLSATDARVTIRGSGFVPSSAGWNGSATLQSEYVSDSQIVVTVPLASFGGPTDMPLGVRNPPPGGGLSNLLVLHLTGERPDAGPGSADGGGDASDGGSADGGHDGGTPDAGPVDAGFQNPVPDIVAVEPAEVLQWSGDSVHELQGTGMLPESVVEASFMWSAIAVTSTYVSPTRIDVTLPASAKATAGRIQLVVANPGPGGGRSATKEITVAAAPAPAPSVAFVVPPSVPVDALDRLVEVRGWSFAEGAQVLLDGTPVPTERKGPGLLRFLLRATDHPATGTHSVKVRNPAAAGADPADSGTLDLVVTDAGTVQPWLDALAPEFAVTVPGEDRLVTLTGANFVRNVSRAFVDGKALMTNYINERTLEVGVPAALLVAGDHQVQVKNGTAVSPLRELKAANPVPWLQSVIPAQIQAGSDEMPVQVYGTGLLPVCTLQADGTNLVTAPTVAPDQPGLEGKVPASMLRDAAMLRIKVSCPAPGGGTSNTLVVPVRRDIGPLPTVASLAPNTLARPSAPDQAPWVTITGTNFRNGARVYLNGRRAATSAYQSETTVTFQPTWEERLPPGTNLSVRVVIPGLAATRAITLPLTGRNPEPTIGGVQPYSRGRGSADRRMTISGTGLYRETVAHWKKTDTQVWFPIGPCLAASWGTCQIVLPPEALANPMNVLMVQNPGSQFSTGNGTYLSNSGDGYSIPLVMAVGKMALLAGRSGQLVTLSGDGFNAAMKVVLPDSTQLTPTEWTANSFTVEIPAGAIPHGTRDLALRLSTYGYLTVSPEVVSTPTFASLSHATARADNAAFELRITGAGMQEPGGRNPWLSVAGGGRLRATAVSATEWTVSVPAGHFKYPGLYELYGDFESWPESNRLPIVVEP